MNESPGQSRLKYLGRKNPMEKPPKNRKKPPMATHLQVGFWKISFNAERNFSTVLRCFPEAAAFYGSYFFYSHLPLVGFLMKNIPSTDEPNPMHAIST